MEILPLSRGKENWSGIPMEPRRACSGYRRGISSDFLPRRIWKSLYVVLTLSLDRGPSYGISFFNSRKIPVYAIEPREYLNGRSDFDPRKSSSSVHVDSSSLNPLFKHGVIVTPPGWWLDRTFFLSVRTIFRWVMRTGRSMLERGYWIWRSLLRKDRRFCWSSRITSVVSMARVQK